MLVDIPMARFTVRASQFVMGTPLSFADKAGAIAKKQTTILKYYENNRNIVSRTIELRIRCAGSSHGFHE
jgi:hypothetical protein